ncbi:TonB-dependent receptor [Maricurvus nonylphenolicus]|uniref:TonB-dependent receptor n=1 Tax=Maricurvus nonylphenolicus TaxID=1008307 RepID=UPI0036F40250
MKKNRVSTLASVISSLAVLPATNAVSEVFQLEEVVVTAQKRAESLQDVPISVSAVNGEKMAEAGVENLQDLSAYVPNLRIVDGGMVPQMFIRGIGSGTNQGFEQSVGTYSDGVYAGRSLQSRAAFLDLERVEVLRGPQSILFGQSSIAGAISLVSAKPTHELEALLSASHVAEYGETELNAVVSGPLSENVGARLALRDRQEDGYMKNNILSGDYPQVDEQAARLTLSWDQGNISSTFKTEIFKLDRQGRTMTPTDLGTYPIKSIAGTHGPLQQTSGQIDHKLWSNEDNQFEFDSESYVLNVDYDFDAFTLTSITSYNEYEYQEDNFDPDTTEVDMLSQDMAEDFEQFSQEIRLTSTDGDAIDYIVGLFYQDSEQSYQEDAFLKVSAIGLDQSFGLPVGILDSVAVRDFGQESKTYAAFGQLTWTLSEELRLTLGLRYTKDKKEGQRSIQSYSLAMPGTLLSDVTLPSPPAPAPNVGLLVADSFNLADHDLSDSYSKENWTPSINLQYDLNSDIMLYVSYSEGYKAAGYDARGNNGWTTALGFPGKSGTELGGESFFFDQEEAETLELGAKMSLLDGSAELNVAIYQTDYTDMQVSVFDGAFGFAVLNAGEAQVRGLELDGRWQVSESLMLNSSLAYLDFEWTDYPAGACNGAGSLPASTTLAGNCDYEGKENVHTPEWSFNFGANHVYMLTDAMELRSALDVNFKDNHYVSNDLDPRSEQHAVTVFNGRIALAAADDSWQLALVGKNLSDQKIFSFAGPISQSDGGIFVNMMRPRTFAIEGNYRF